MATGQLVGFWEGLYTSIADELCLMAGNLLTRTQGPTAAGAATINVESTDRWPDAGRFIADGAIGFYTSKTVTTLDGVTDALGNPGAPIALRPNSVVMDLTRQKSQLDDLRASFLVDEAEGTELDILARNFGLTRPRGLDDTLFQQLLQVLLFVEAQTMWACEQVLDVLFGPGNYELYEDTESAMHQVFVRLPLLGSSASSFQGKTYLASGEPQPATGPNTVDTDNPVQLVYGVYDAADPFRQGTNFGNAVLAATTSVGQPQSILTAGLWLPADVGKGVKVLGPGAGDERWFRVATFVSANEVQVESRERSRAQVDSGALTIIRSEDDVFAPWMVGSTIEVTTGPNLGVHTIAAYINSRQVQMAAPLAADADIGWKLVPVFATAAGLTVEVLRATAVGSTVTTPQALPANVLVDYVHVPSAQMMGGPNLNGDNQYPFYLWDETAIAQFVLDLITAAGVEVVVELT